MIGIVRIAHGVPNVMLFTSDRNKTTMFTMSVDGAVAQSTVSYNLITLLSKLAGIVSFLADLHLNEIFTRIVPRL